MEKNLKCVKYGKEMREEMKYCPYCGAAVADVSGNITADTLAGTL